jgi:hypothetical protein
VLGLDDAAVARARAGAAALVPHPHLPGDDVLDGAAAEPARDVG